MGYNEKIIIYKKNARININNVCSNTILNLIITFILNPSLINSASYPAQLDSPMTSVRQKQWEAWGMINWWVSSNISGSQNIALTLVANSIITYKESSAWAWAEIAMNVCLGKHWINLSLIHTYCIFVDQHVQLLT